MDPILIEVLTLANSLSSHVHACLDVHITSIRQCNSLLFSQLYLALTGSEIPSLSSELARCQAVVEGLSSHLSPHVSLEHIQGVDLARLDVLSIKNLLDIFAVLFCLPPSTTFTGSPDQRDIANDSNLLSNEGFSVISEVLREELGPHSTGSYTDSTTELLRPVPRAPLPPSLMTRVTKTTVKDRTHTTFSTSVVGGTSQTTPTQSPDRRQRVLQSPLHHSTPHTSTRSRIFPSSSPSQLPQTLTYSQTPHQEHRLNPSTHKPSPQPTSRESSSLVLPDSPHSSIIPDLTITDLHSTVSQHTTLDQSRLSQDESTYCDTPITPLGQPTRNENAPRVRFTASTERRDRHGNFQSNLSESRTRTNTSLEVSTTLGEPEPQSTSGEPDPQSSSGEPDRRSSSRPPLEQSSISCDQSIGSCTVNGLNKAPSLEDQLVKSRASVLATLYKNYLREVSRGDKGQHHTRQRSKVTISRKNKRAKAHKYSKPVRSTRPSKLHPPQESSEEEDERQQTPEKVAVGDNLLPLVESEFPFVHISPSMMHGLWQKQVQQIKALTAGGVRSGAVSGEGVRVKEMERRHQALLNVIKKEIQHTHRMQRLQEQRSQRQTVLTSVHSKRQSAARAKRYFHDYELRLKAKLQRKRTREEQIFKRAFENGLDLQRERVREMRRFAKERRETNAKQHQEKLEAMENYYRDQFAMLTESMLTERGEVSIREKAQNKLVQSLRRELREKMEKEIKNLQDCLDGEEDVAHFRELDEQKLRHKLANLTFTSTVH